MSETNEEAKASPRLFTDDSVRHILHNLFYTGVVVKENRSKTGTATNLETRPGHQAEAVPKDDFDAIQAILRRHRRVPRTSSRKLRPYLLKGLLYCDGCGELVYSQFINGQSYYRESSPHRGLVCVQAGVYWPARTFDRQIEEIVRSIHVSDELLERAMELADNENSITEMRGERADLDNRRQRFRHLYREGHIAQQEFDREMIRIENRLLTVAPAEIEAVELTYSDFEDFAVNWQLATPEEKYDMLSAMIERVYGDMGDGAIREIVPKAGFRWLLEASGIVKSPEEHLGDFPLT